MSDKKLTQDYEQGLATIARLEATLRKTVAALVAREDVIQGLLDAIDAVVEERVLVSLDTATQLGEAVMRAKEI